MKNYLILLAVLSFSISAMAQREDHPHYEKHYGAVEAIETDELRIEIIEPHSQESHTQFTAKIYNKTSDYILIKRHETLFKSSGNGEKYPKESTVFIEPNGDITRPFKIEGGVGFKVDALDITFGGFSRASLDGKPVGAGEFKMKPEKNSVMMEPFGVTVKKWKYNPKELTADFKIRYWGGAIGLVNESKIKIRKEDGTILENRDGKDKPFLITPNKARTVNVIQFFDKGAIAKGESVYVVWGEALLEAESTPLTVPGFSLTHDADKTKKMNK